MTYIIVKNRKVEMMAYSMSCVALNAIARRDTYLKSRLSNIVFNFFGTEMALPENNPW